MSVYEDEHRDEVRVIYRHGDAAIRGHHGFTDGNLHASFSEYEDILHVNPTHPFYERYLMRIPMRTMPPRGITPRPAPNEWGAKHRSTEGLTPFFPCFSEGPQDVAKEATLSPRAAHSRTYALNVYLG